MKAVDINGIHLNEKMIEQLKDLQENNNSSLEAHVNMVIDVSDFLVEHSFDIQGEEKQLLNHIQALILVRDILKNFRIIDDKEESE
jgi:hypothetical protein